MKDLVVATLVVGLLACCNALPSGVVRFEAEETKVLQKSQVGTFQFSNCLPVAQEVLAINSLSLSPDPLVFPGPLTVSFDASDKSTVDAPLKAVVVLERKIGSTYIKIPCIGNIGSCTYDDLCQLLSQITQCPDPFVSAGIPCKCPFKSGHYKLPSASFDVETSLFPPGDYKGQANLTMNGQAVGCYQIMATFG